MTEQITAETVVRPNDEAFTITDTDEPVDVTNRRRWPVIVASVTAALVIGGGGLIAYDHHHAATQLQQEKESLIQRHPMPSNLPGEGGHVWGTQPGEGGGNLSDLQDGSCPSHMTEYPGGKCVPESERKSRASEFLPLPSDCESGVLILNPTPHCETMREKVGDEFRRNIEQLQQEQQEQDAAAKAATQG